MMMTLMMTMMMTTLTDDDDDDSTVERCITREGNDVDSVSRDYLWIIDITVIMMCLRESQRNNSFRMKSNRTMPLHIFPRPNESLDLNREFCIEIILWVDGVASRLLTILKDSSQVGSEL